MSNIKQKWSSLSLPFSLTQRMKAVLPYTGNQSLAEYARFAIQERLRVDEIYAVEAMEKEQEIEERLKD